MHIDFYGRGVHIRTERGAIILYPDEVFQLVAWAKEHEWTLLFKEREMQRIEDAKQRAEQQQKGSENRATEH